MIGSFDSFFFLTGVGFALTFFATGDLGAVTLLVAFFTGADLVGAGVAALVVFVGFKACLEIGFATGLAKVFAAVFATVFATGFFDTAVLLFFVAAATGFDFAVWDTLEGLGLAALGATLGALGATLEVGDAFLAVAEIVLPLGFLDLGVDINPQQVVCWCLLTRNSLYSEYKAR
jgi:hypothetical protein